MSLVIIDMIFFFLVLGFVGKGSWLLDLGFDYKFLMSGKVFFVVFLVYYGCDVVLFEILKCFLYLCVVDCSVLFVFLFNSVSFTYFLVNIC